MATQALGLDPKQPDRFITTDPDHWIRVRWWVCPRGAVSALCPARGDVFPDDSSPFGYTVESVQEQKRDDATVFLVTTYLKPKVEEYVGNLGELKRRVTRRTIRGSYGIRRFVGAESTIDSDVAAQLPLNSGWPDEDIQAWSTRLQDIEVDHDRRPGVSYVTAHYRPFTPGRLLEQTPGKGILSVAYFDLPRRKEYDLDGHPMELVMDRGSGIAGQSSTYIRRWHVIEGNPEQIQGAGMLLRVEVVLESPPLSDLASCVGGVNDGALSNFGAVGQEGYLMFLRPDPPAQQLYRNQSLMRLWLNLAWIGKKWNESVVSELQRAKALETPVYNESGADTGRKRDLLTWPAETGVEGYRHNCKIGEPVDLSWLNEYLNV